MWALRVTSAARPPPSHVGCAGTVRSSWLPRRLQTWRNRGAVRELQRSSCRLYHTDPYQLLGIAPTDDLAEIKRAFRTRALALHPDRVPEEQRAGALRQFNEVLEAFEQLSRSDEDWRVRQERDFAQWLRDELAWARARLRMQRSRVLGAGGRPDMPSSSANSSPTEARAAAPAKLTLRPEDQQATKIHVATAARKRAKARRLAKLEALEQEQELEQELAWAHAKAAAARRQSGAPPVEHEVAAAARRLAKLGISVDRINNRTSAGRVGSNARRTAAPEPEAVQ